MVTMLRTSPPRRVGCNNQYHLTFHVYTIPYIQHGIDHTMVNTIPCMPCNPYVIRHIMVYTITQWYTPLNLYTIPCIHTPPCLCHTMVHTVPYMHHTMYTPFHMHIALFLGKLKKDKVTKGSRQTNTQNDIGTS